MYQRHQTLPSLLGGGCGQPDYLPPWVAEVCDCSDTTTVLHRANTTKKSWRQVILTAVSCSSASRHSSRLNWFFCNQSEQQQLLQNTYYYCPSFILMRMYIGPFLGLFRADADHSTYYIHVYMQRLSDIKPQNYNIILLIFCQASFYFPVLGRNLQSWHLVVESKMKWVFLVISKQKRANPLKSQITRAFKTRDFVQRRGLSTHWGWDFSLSLPPGIQHYVS